MGINITGIGNSYGSTGSAKNTNLSHINNGSSGGKINLSGENSTSINKSIIVGSEILKEKSKKII